VTRVPHAGAPHGGASTLVVRVAGVQWHEVQYLYGSGPQARVYVVETEDDGSTFVRFGDGTTGARVPSGAHVSADYRTGLGTKGNVGAGSLTSALTRPKGLHAVGNPLPASGGGDAETTEDARLNAPNTVRTFERIVSLRDAADQARENAMVGKATSAWTRVGTELGVAVTVAGAGGAQLGAAQLADLRADLDARRDPNRPLVVRGYRPVALSISVRLIAIAADRAAKDVQAAATAALLEHFAFAARDFGQPVRLSEVYVAAQRAVGVIGVDVDTMTLADAGQRSAHLLGAQPLHDRIDLEPDELATLRAVDLTVTVAA
jgi:predicted phage baseplate assembly protein